MGEQVLTYFAITTRSEHIHGQILILHQSWHLKTHTGHTKEYLLYHYPSSLLASTSFVHSRSPSLAMTVAHEGAVCPSPESGEWKLRKNPPLPFNATFFPASLRASSLFPRPYMCRSCQGTSPLSLMPACGGKRRTEWYTKAHSSFLVFHLPVRLSVTHWLLFVALTLCHWSSSCLGFHPNFRPLNPSQVSMFDYLRT